MDWNNLKNFGKQQKKNSIKPRKSKERRERKWKKKFFEVKKNSV